MGAFAAAGVLTGRNHRAAADFALGGRKSSAAGVVGVLLGALVGGASTVGTVQMAYSFGARAIWFTCGGGIGCMLLGLCFASPLRNSGITTISDYLEKSFGGDRRVSLLSAVSSSLGTLISICAQFVSCTALLRGVFPVSGWAASIFSACLILGFIASGGLKSFSRLGAAKIILLYAALILCAAAAVKRGGTFSAVASALPAHPWFNPFSMGTADFGAIVSMVVGIFTTQIYIQSLASAKDAKTARNGALSAALLMPPMGFLGTWIGLSVRAGGVDIPPEQTLPWFIMNSFPPAAAGVIWAGIMITVVGCAAGLLLGVSTNIAKNLLPKGLMKGGAESAASQRKIILFFLLPAVVFGVFGKSAIILEMAYLGMGLRGAGTFLPFAAAMLRPGALSPRWALASCAGGLAGMFAWAFCALPGDPLFAGLAVSAVCVLTGLKIRK